MAKMSWLSHSLSLCLLLLVLAFIGPSRAEKRVEIFELSRGPFTVRISNYGATVLSFFAPDRSGKLDDIALGFGSIGQATNDTTYIGALVGRVANRIGGARFTLDGKHYKLVRNDGNNTLHGGHRGFGDAIWNVASYRRNSHLTLSYESFDGEQGFPGNLSVSVTYMFIGTNKFALKMVATPVDKPTPVNLATHIYWNLAGHGDILSHNVQLFASSITPVNDELIPTGEIKPVEGTPYDFLKPHKIGSRIDQLTDGYDVNYVLDGQSDGRHLRKVAIVQEKDSGRKMELWANQPGVQFYSGNMLHDQKGKYGMVYGKHAGLCLETQGFPDSVNHPNFPSQIVYPGHKYVHFMVYKFTAN